jgi:pantetheine-phosphate adenylyltransferase
MKSALLAGSFDPPTLGHISLIKRAAQLFSKLYVGLATNESKKPLFPIPQRLAWLKSLTKDIENIEVLSFTGLTVETAKNIGAGVLLRGARNGCDYEIESAMAYANYKLAKIETLILPAEPETAHISSSIIKDIFASRGALDDFLPQEIVKDFRP